MPTTIATTPQLALRFGRSKAVIAVSSIEDASRQWQAYRDAEGLGASESPKVSVVNVDTGKTVATVSYNGKVWPPGKWNADMKPLYNPFREWKGSMSAAAFMANGLTKENAQ
jgi:hypothetical protein